MSFLQIITMVEKNLVVQMLVPRADSVTAFFQNHSPTERFGSVPTFRRKIRHVYCSRRLLAFSTLACWKGGNLSGVILGQGQKSAPLPILKVHLWHFGPNRALHPFNYVARKKSPSSHVLKTITRTVLISTGIVFVSTYTGTSTT